MDHKYAIGTLVLSNIPYSYGDFRREREIGMIIDVYKRTTSFTTNTVCMYVVEWCSPLNKVPAAYTEEVVNRFVDNLNRYLEKDF